jgi:hypothetical protein
MATLLSAIAVIVVVPGDAGPSVAPCPPPVVGIVDSGVDPAGLAASIDRSAGADLVSGRSTLDLDGHGTEMAWIVHAEAPRARLAIARVVDARGSTTDGRIAAAVDHLRRRGASIVLISLAGAEPLPATRAAIAAGAGRFVAFAAAGNDGADLDRVPSYPGGYRLPNLVTVAALGRDGRLWGSSNRGGPISATAPASAATRTLGARPTTSVGTSAAAAIAAGRAAHAASTACGARSSRALAAAT